MASIVINEVDNTTSTIYSPTETVVFIPGMLGKGHVNTEIIGVPTLFTTEAEFEEAIGTTPAIISDSDATEIELDKSFVMAKQLLALGMPVLYEVVQTSTGAAAKTKEEMITVLSTDAFWQEKEDRALYNPRFITSGGYAAIQNTTAGTESIANAMINLAHYTAGNGTTDSKGRGDCVALIDHPKSLTKISDIYNLFNDDTSFAKKLADGYGTFAAAFTPWCKFNLTISLSLENPGTGKSYIDTDKNGFWTLPPSFAYLVAYNYMLSGYDTWFAAAGKARGVVPLMQAPLADFGDKACKAIQSRAEGKIAVNPIVNMRPYGYRIFGNRTLKQNQEGLKATSFLNIRNLVSDIKKICYQACRVQTFEQNTDVMWVGLKALITPTLDKMVTGQGISGYSIKRVATNERAKVVGIISITPIEAVEDFELTVELTDSLSVETEAE